MKHLFSNIYNYWRTFDFTSPRVINSLKTAIACLIGYAVVLFTPLPQAQWIVITTVVVMSAQTSIGSLMITSYMRFLGTISGALLSALAFIVIGKGPVAIGVELFLCTLLFAYIASNSGAIISVAGTMGGVTVAIILLNSVVGFEVVVSRSVEIILGIIIALLVSKCLFPIHAHRLLLKEISANLLNLQRHFSRCMRTDPTQLTIDVNTLDAKIVNSFTNQRKLIHAIEFEFGKYRQRKAELKNILQAQIKIYRANNLMFMSAHVSPESVKTIGSLEILEQFRQEGKFSLEWLAGVFRMRKKQPRSFAMAEVLANMEYEFNKSIEEKHFKHISYVNAFIFGTRMFVNELLALEKIVKTIMDKSNDTRVD